LPRASVVETRWVRSTAPMPRCAGRGTLPSTRSFYFGSTPRWSTALCQPIEPSSPRSRSPTPKPFTKIQSRLVWPWAFQDSSFQWTWQPSRAMSQRCFKTRWCPPSRPRNWPPQFFARCVGCRVRSLHRLIRSRQASCQTSCGDPTDCLRPAFGSASCGGVFPVSTTGCQDQSGSCPKRVERVGPVLQSRLVREVGRSRGVLEGLQVDLSRIETPTLGPVERQSLGRRRAAGISFSVPGFDPRRAVPPQVGPDPVRILSLLFPGRPAKPPRLLGGEATWVPTGHG